MRTDKGRPVPWFIMGRPAPDEGALDLRAIDGDAAALVDAVVRECRLRSFATVRVTVGSRPGLVALASIARRAAGVKFDVLLRGGIADLGQAGGLDNVTAD